VCDSEMLDTIAAYIARGIIRIYEWQNKKLGEEFKGGNRKIRTVTFRKGKHTAK
jgi:hypothetical protein